MSKGKKIALGVVGGLVLVIGGVLVAAAMQPDTFEVERSREIAASAEQIHPQIADLRRWAEWNPWKDLDPNQTLRFSDPAAGVDAWYEWEGNDDVGKGRMTIVASSPTEVRYRLAFIEPFPSEADIAIRLEPDGEATRVVWSMSGDNDFMGKLFGLFMDFEASIAADFDRGLENLAGTVEG